jgi:outer membrane biosynthesis protein TonB
LFFQAPPAIVDPVLAAELVAAAAAGACHSRSSTGAYSFGDGLEFEGPPNSGSSSASKVAKKGHKTPVEAFELANQLHNWAQADARARVLRDQQQQQKQQLQDEEEKKKRKVKAKKDKEKEKAQKADERAFKDREREREKEKAEKVRAEKKATASVEKKQKKQQQKTVAISVDSDGSDGSDDSREKSPAKRQKRGKDGALLDKVGARVLERKSRFDLPQDARKRGEMADLMACRGLKFEI